MEGETELPVLQTAKKFRGDKKILESGKPGPMEDTRMWRVVYGCDRKLHREVDEGVRREDRGEKGQ